MGIDDKRIDKIPLGNDIPSQDIISKIDIEAKNEIDDEDISSETITNPFSPNDIRINTPPMNLGDLIDMIQYKWINFGTDYQRAENLWSAKQQSRLIESALLGLRLPAFYFEEVSKKQWNIIDGLQRCCSIRNFCVDQTLLLSELEFLSEYTGFTFDMLPFELKRDIRMLPITVNVLEAGVPKKVKYILFKRLNTGGIELTQQEIRNAVFKGKAIDVISRMSIDSNFLKSTEGKIPTKRGHDKDFVSRFASFYLNGYQNYKPDLENFINSTMESINDGFFPDEDIRKMEEDFSKANSLALQIFGNDAYRKRDNSNKVRNRLNKAYFEVITTVFARLDEDKILKLLTYKDCFICNLITAMRDSKSYSYSFSGGTGGIDSVKRRFS
ncbi:MAG: DUF262 domain-containing protein, partial [Rikenellaceae bacterium]